MVESSVTECSPVRFCILWKQSEGRGAGGGGGGGGGRTRSRATTWPLASGANLHTECRTFSRSLVSACSSVCERRLPTS